MLCAVYRQLVIGAKFNLIPKLLPSFQATQREEQPDAGLKRKYWKSISAITSGSGQSRAAFFCRQRITNDSCLGIVNHT